MDYNLQPDFPVKRHRRLRNNPIIRDMIAETRLSLNDLIYPLFIIHGNNIKNEIPSMPDCFQFSIDRVIDEIKELIDMGIRAILLFGIPEKKDELGSDCFAENGLIQKCVREIKAKFGDKILVITDLCLCEYKSDGHCGIVKDGKILNDETLEILQKVALAQAKAGSDMIAPSDMMDGRVAAIRKILNENNFIDLPIMSYSAKYSSAFYGPFRDAAGSAPSFGDRKSHQLDMRNCNEAMSEIASDIKEGADIVMVKPAMAYLDVIRKAKDTFNIPIAAYNVSGEYAMIKAAGKLGWLDDKRCALEVLTSIKRAGADIIISYHTKEIANILKSI